MANGRVLQSWTMEEVQAVVHYERTCGTPGTDIHSHLMEVYGPDIMSTQIVRWWWLQFQDGHTSMLDDVRSRLQVYLHDHSTSLSDWRRCYLPSTRDMVLVFIILLSISLRWNKHIPTHYMGTISKKWGRGSPYQVCYKFGAFLYSVQWRSSWYSHRVYITIVRLNFLFKKCVDYTISRGYRIHSQGNGAQFPAGTRDSSVLHSSPTSFGAHPFSCPIGTGGYFPGGKVAGAWSWLLASTHYQGWEWWSYTSTLPYLSHMSSWCDD
jgi:hypothetical protein